MSFLPYSNSARMIASDVARAGVAPASPAIRPIILTVRRPCHLPPHPVTDGKDFPSPSASDWMRAALTPAVWPIWVATLFATVTDLTHLSCEPDDIDLLTRVISCFGM